MDPATTDDQVLAAILDRMLDLLERGETLFSQGRAEEARDHLEVLRALTAGATQIHAHVLTDLAVIASRLGDRAEAVELAREALVHHPDHPPALEVLEQLDGPPGPTPPAPDGEPADGRDRVSQEVTVAGKAVHIVRRETPEDIGVVHQIFTEECYSLDRLDAWTGLERYARRDALHGRRPLIVDCGANIGASSAYFAHRYPDATVIAVEPESDNFGLLCENTAGLENVRPLRAAIAGQPGRVVLTDPGWGAWGYRTGGAAGEGTVIDEVDATSVADLLEQEADAVPFILKVDIEGAESDLFFSHGDALGRFPLVVVELHDWMMPGGGTSHSFLQWHVSQGNRDFVHHGENIFSVLRELAAPAPARSDTTQSDTTLDGRIVLGHRSYIFKPPTVTRYDGDPDHPIVVGAYCSISENVEFMIGGNHRPDWVTTYPLRGALGLPGAGQDGHPASKGPIVIGNDVWIAKNVLILSGVRIGDGAVVGAGSVVTRDVRPYAIVAGNPAREVRRRFDDDVVDELLAIAWWNWSDDEVLAAHDLLSGAGIAEFLAYARERRPSQADRSAAE